MVLHSNMSDIVDDGWHGFTIFIIIKKMCFFSFHFLSLGLKCAGHYLQLLLEFSFYCIGVRPFDFTSRHLPINSQAMLHILCVSRGLKSNTQAIICCDRNYNHNEK